MPKTPVLIKDHGRLSSTVAEGTSQTLLLTIQQQAQELQQLRTESTVLRQALVSRTTDVPTISATTPRFSGNLNKLRESLDALMVYYLFRPSQFVQDKAKVGYLISALYGPALAWATPLVATNDSRLSDYTAFVAAFKQMFEHPGLES
ncbi:protein LDOC1-like [Pleurodeles waltl]|uniref:protein LDOC1-like n=1 Tax=Pleurodeles waltl TaxID=8319 RepID=UPI0037095A08